MCNHVKKPCTLLDTGDADSVGNDSWAWTVTAANSRKGSENAVALGILICMTFTPPSATADGAPWYAIGYRNWGDA